MRSTDPSRKTAERAAQAAQILGGLLMTCQVTGGAVLNANIDPAIVARTASLDDARQLADVLDLTWHSQATGSGAGALYVHAFEGLLGAFPVTVYALGEHDPDAVTVEGTVGLPLLLGGLVL
jgi:hypothetical protein